MTFLENKAHRAPKPDQSDHPPTNAPPLDALAAEINAAYQDLGHQLGWRFVTGPRATFPPSSAIALITLNPGGSRDDSDTYDQASSENGSAYYVESWDGQPAGADKLQLQVQALFAGIQRHLEIPGATRHFVETQVLTAHFLPFRSKNFKALPARSASLRFAKQLWTSILAGMHLGLVIHLSTESYKAFCDILRDQSGVHAKDERSFATGWGNYQAKATRFIWSDSGKSTTVARLPHLSRFALFGRPESRPYLETFLDYVTEDLRSE